MINSKRRQIEINVKLYLALKEYLPKEADGKEVIQFFQDKVTMGDLLKAIKIPPEEIMVIFVNSVGVTEEDDVSDRELQDGDTVEIFGSIIAGG